MNNYKKIWIRPFIIIGVFVFISGSCGKDPIPGTLAVISTGSVIDITHISASSGGEISSDGEASISARGVCWSTETNPTIKGNKTTDGSGSGSFESSIKGLASNKTYYVRAYATNAAGTAYGNQLSFKTYTGVVSDIDGNQYYTVTIGTQVWMAGNLKTTRYRNGNPIPNCTGDLQWENLISGAYCNYNNDTSFVRTYGHLYNWHAIGDSRNIAPAGWHVATDADWTTLINLLGEKNAAGKLKESGITHWISPNHGAINEYGFTALPGGYRNHNGPFGAIGEDGWWWTSTMADEAGDRFARFCEMENDQITVYQGVTYKNKGFSVRCIKD